MLSPTKVEIPDTFNVSNLVTVASKLVTVAIPVTLRLNKVVIPVTCPFLAINSSNTKSSRTIRSPSI